MVEATDHLGRLILVILYGFIDRISICGPQIEVLVALWDHRLMTTKYINII